MDTKPTEVKVLRVENGMYLVEWQEPDAMINRFWVREDMVDNLAGNQGVVTNPKRGVPFGDNLLEGFSSQLSNRDFERELRIRKIWKYSDVVANPNGVVQAIQAALGIDLAAMLNLAQQHTRK